MRLKKEIGELYRRHYRALLRFVLWKLHDRSLAEDIVHQTFLRFWLYLNKSDREIPEHPFAALRKTAKNLITDNWRKTSKMDCIPFDEEAYTAVSLREMADTAMDQQITHGDHQRALILLQSLPPSYRTIALMHYCDGLEPIEIAKRTGKTAGHVRVILFRARKKMLDGLGH